MIPTRPARHSIETSDEAGVRYLHFGSTWVQGAMRLRRPDALELEYTREMLFCLLWRDWSEWPREVLVIGLGAGSLVKFLHRHLPKARLTVIEIDDRLPALVADRFAVPLASPRIRLLIDDGSRHVRVDAAHHDLILVDGFDHRARAGPLDTDAFYRHCRSRLAPGGVMATNLFGRSRRFDASLGRIDAAFDGRVVVLPPGEAGNVITFGLTGDGADDALTRADLLARAAALAAETGLGLRPTIDRMSAAGMLPGGVLRL